jgi:hypothetical protein
LVSRQIDSRITRFDANYKKVLRTHAGSDKPSSIGNKSYTGILDTPVVVSQFIQDARKSHESNNRALVEAQFLEIDK